MTNTRELTPSEAKAVDLCRTLERALDERRLVITLISSKEAAELISRLETHHKAIKTLRAEFIPKQSQYAITFTILEFKRYVDFALRLTGMRIQIDGSLKTYDNMIITNEYLN